MQPLRTDKIAQPLGIKQNHGTSWANKNHATSWDHKNHTNARDKNKTMPPLWTKIACNLLDMQPLRTKNHATTRDKKKQANSRDKKKQANSWDKKSRS